jgi:hypothetical protein
MVAHRLLAAACALAAAAAAGCAAKDNTVTGHGPLPPCTAAASTVSLGVGAYAAYDIVADSGCAVFPANASTTDSAEYLVVVQAAGGTPGDSAAYRIAARVSGLPPAPAAGATLPATPLRLTATQNAFYDRLRATARRIAPEAARAERLALSAAQPGVARVITPPDSGTLRTFSVCANLTCGVYQPVTARALKVGAHIALYEDTLAPANGLSTTDIDSLSKVFDQVVYPLDTAAFGRESDIDSNGVVIVLLTNVVNAMVTTAQCDTGGYVTGFFDASDLDPATSAQRNHGEVFYGVVPDPAGTLSCAHPVAEVTSQLPVTFAHEFEHMINFVQHVLVRGGSPEDDWLDESLAKYAEELTGDAFAAAGDSASWSNDLLNELYNLYQYLEAPEQHYLLTTTDQSLADVGAGWMFVRYLVDQNGTGITAKLVQTPLTGTANVAAQTGLPFATLDERWALAGWVSDLPGFTPPGELRYTTYSWRQLFDDVYTVFPQYFPRPFPLVPTLATPGTLDVTGSLRAGSGVYLLVHQGPNGGADTLHVNTGAAPLPAALVPQFAVIRLH